MANTYTLPTESGWGASAYLAMRLHVTQTYDAQNNKSTLVVKLQGRYPGSGTYNDMFAIRAAGQASGTLKCNGTTIVQFPVNSDYTVVSKDSTWRDMTYNGSPWSYTLEVSHGADGKATVTFALDAMAISLYGTSAYNTNLQNKTATLSLSETPQSGGTTWIYDSGWYEYIPCVYDGGWKECDANIYDNGWVNA